MKVKHVLSHRVVEVADHYGKSLIAAGFFEPADAPEASAPTQSPQRSQKGAQKGAQTQK